MNKLENDNRSKRRKHHMSKSVTFKSLKSKRERLIGERWEAVFLSAALIHMFSIKIDMNQTLCVVSGYSF